MGHPRALEEIESSGRGPAELVGAELLEGRGEYGEALRWFDRAISAEDPDDSPRSDGGAQYPR